MKRNSLCSIISISVLGITFLFSSSLFAEERHMVGQVNIKNRNYARLDNNKLVELISIDKIRSFRSKKAVDIQRLKDHFSRVNAMIAIPGAFTLQQNQTSIKNQAGRGTCWIMATTAAIEAAYKREYNATLDLSEQYFQHVAKSTTLQYPKVYNYSNQSSFWNGGSTQHATRKAMEFRIPTEAYEPYKTNAEMISLRDSIPGTGPLIWNRDATVNIVTQQQVDNFEYSPLYISKAARQNARYGVKKALFLNASDTRNTDFMERTLVAGNEIAVGFSLDWRRDPATNIYEYDSSVNGDGHAMLVIGYDRPGGYFILKNSWGGNQYLFVSYEFMEEASSGGTVITEVIPPTEAPKLMGLWLGPWNMDHDGYRGQMIIRRLSDTTEKKTRLGTYVKNGKTHPVNGVLTTHYRQLNFNIDFNAADNQPGSISGQPFTTYLYTRDPVFASGFTTWSRQKYGVHLSKSQIPGRTRLTKAWTGSWDMDHDGHKGVLVLDQKLSNNVFSLLEGSYTKGGKSHKAQAIIVSSKPNRMILEINFNSSNKQLFELFRHTWENGIFSGTTTWNNGSFGVHGLQ